MAAQRADAVPQAEELDEVILAYVEAVEAGQSPDPRRLAGAATRSSPASCPPSSPTRTSSSMVATA